MNLERCSAVIVVFAMDGCPACEDYKPRLVRQVKRWQQHGARFVVAERPQEFSPSVIPVLLLDAQNANPQIQDVANQYGVTGLPTTILFRRWHGPTILEGAIGDREIEAMLHDAHSA